MREFIKKLAQAYVETFIKEVSEQSVKWAIGKSKEYVSHTIEKGRRINKERNDA
jgi:hypothetical protein